MELQHVNLLVTVVSLLLPPGQLANMSNGAVNEAKNGTERCTTLMDGGSITHKLRRMEEVSFITFQEMRPSGIDILH